jgi:serine/threonine-protein phosphatase 6 regulatory ankyrin repeat subunit B
LRLQIAVRTKCAQLDAYVARVLLEAGAVVGALSNDGTTASMYAAKNGHEQIARVLLEAGAVVGAQDNDGRTALMLASQKG